MAELVHPYRLDAELGLDALAVVAQAEAGLDRAWPGQQCGDLGQAVRVCSWKTQACSSVASCTTCGPSDSWPAVKVGLDSVSKPQALLARSALGRALGVAGRGHEFDAIEPEALEGFEQVDLLLAGRGGALVHS